jgi:cysteine-rich repeat protein
MRLRNWLLLLAVLAVGTPYRGTAASADPNQAARKCRTAIAKGAKLITGTGLATLDSCHKRRDQGKFQGDCNVLDGTPNFSRAETRAQGLIDATCRSGDPVRANYPGDDVSGVVEQGLSAVLTESAQGVQGLPDILPDPGDRKAHARCHAAIGKARSTIVREIVARSTTCQKRLDKQATSFTFLDPQCRVGQAGSSGRAAVAITKACGSLTGPDVGSCDALPDCVIQAATLTGQSAAANVYGAFECGDGIVQAGEQCDDANTVDGDECTNSCKRARCGDGVVETGVEQCDDGNRFDNDACRNDCTLPVCGDGKLAEGVEECDDGNTAAGDGCSPDCHFEIVNCGSGGADVTVALKFEPLAVPDLSGVTVDLGYPQGTVDLPGTGAAVGSRVTDLAGKGLLSPNDHHCGSPPACPTPPDPELPGADDTLTVVYTTVGNTLTPGDLARGRFDCAAGTGLLPQNFACIVRDAVDSFGNSIPGLVACTASIATAAGP